MAGVSKGWWRVMLAGLIAAAGGDAPARMLPAARAPAETPRWAFPDSPALGLLAEQCQDEFCFAVACPRQRLQLVNYSGGGGPYGFAIETDAARIATLVVGGQTYKLFFTADNRIMHALNVAGSRADLPVSALTALATTTGAIVGTTTSRGVKANLRSAGLRELWPRIAQSCGLSALAPR